MLKFRFFACLGISLPSRMLLDPAIFRSMSINTAMMPFIDIPSNVHVFRSRHYRTYFTTRKIGSVPRIVKSLRKQLFLEIDRDRLDHWVRWTDENGRNGTNQALKSLFSRLAIRENARLSSASGTEETEQIEVELVKLRCEAEEVLRAHLWSYP